MRFWLIIVIGCTYGQSGCMIEQRHQPWIAHTIQRVAPLSLGSYEIGLTQHV